MKKKLLSLLLVAIMLSATVLGCTTTGGDENSTTTAASDSTAAVKPAESTAASEGTALAEEQVFNFAGNNDIMSLDASLMNDEMSALVMYAVNEGLIRYSEGKIIPGIAEKYDISADGITYTFHLRDAKWSDGQPVTAKDFEYAFLRLLNPATGSSQVEDFSSIVNADEYSGGKLTDATKVGIKATDDKTLVITLIGSDPFFLERMAQGINFYPIRKDYVDKFGEKYASGADSFIGCGPFVLAKWEQGASITMEKNTNYWDAGKIILNKVVENIISDENTSAGMYDMGDIDGIYSITKAQTEKYTNFGTRSGGTLQHLVFTSKQGAVLSNKNLRLALSYAVDRQAIIKAISAPGTTVASSMIDPGISLNGESILKKYPASNNIVENGDVEKAKSYLAAALKEMNVANASKLPTIKYVCLESPTHKAYAEALQARWAEVLGIKVDVKIMPVPQAIGSLLSGEFDIFLNGMSTGVSPETLLNNYVIGSSNNYAKWSNQEYTDLMAASKSAATLEERFANLQKAHQIILDECPVAPLWFPGSAYLCQDYVKGLYYGRETGSIEFIYASILKH